MSEKKDRQSRQRPYEILLTDFLSQKTHALRRTLLAVCAIGLTIALAKIVPKEITNLGIKFEPTDRRTMLWLIAAIVAYFFVAFVIYAICDFLKWKTFRSQIGRESEIDRILGEQPLQKIHQQLRQNQETQKLLQMRHVHDKYPLPHHKAVAAAA
jgi:hypothetical protein